VILVGVEAPYIPKSTKQKHIGNEFKGLPPDARVNFDIDTRSGLKLLPIGHQSDSSDALEILAILLENSGCWIVDALFGTGLSRALKSPFDELVSMVNSSPHPIFAVDIPSGLDSDSGEPLGPTIRATHTATFVAHKRGFLNPESKKWTGEIHVIDIGAPRVLVDEYRNRRR
jgi:hydroxyethylthiazole kinase-like uncharacterized protein yjeF